MEFENGNASYRMAKVIMDQLVHSGVKCAVVSPGFRNSPLILAARHASELEIFTSVDERGAAFFALGISKASGKPVAVFCTSGTATANYLPAIMEANHSHLPLIVITADRPEELVGTGANQTTVQTGLYSNHVRESFEIPPPAPGVDFESRGSYVIGKAVAASLSPRPGPVHVNVRFREPFLPQPTALEEINGDRFRPKFTFFPSSSGPSLEQSEALEKMFATAERPLFVLGPNLGVKRLAKLSAAARLHGIPVLSEAASGFGFQSERRNCVTLQRSDDALRAFSDGTLRAPDLVARFGSPLLSKEYGRFLKASRSPQIIFDEFQEAREPDGNSSVFIQGGMEGWLEAISRWQPARRAAADWLRELEEFEASVERDLEGRISGFPELTEWGFHRQLGEFLSNGSFLFLGNSMPIRDFNSVFPKLDKELTIFSNRGQSGIDGLISSAAGVALASRKETHAVLGDLSTLHDLSAFSLLDRIRNQTKLTLWILNNGGGEIFRIIPTAGAGKEEWFTTPEKVDFSSIAKAFRIPYTRITKMDELRTLERTFGSEPGVRVVEIFFDPAANGRIRKKGT